MKQIFLFFLLFISACNSNTQKQILGKDSTNIIIVQQDDDEMSAAISMAKSSLNQFDSALLSKKSRYNSFSLKVRFPYGDNSGEHIWLSDITKYKDEYMGIVNNEPEYVSTLKLYDTIKINKNNISDWMYLDKKILKGGFTIKLLRKRMSSGERAQFDSTRFYELEE